MKSRYRRKAVYFDEGTELTGYVDKRGFHPDKDQMCGFGLQILTNREKKHIRYVAEEKSRHFRMAGTDGKI